MTANRRTFTDCLISSFYRFLARFSGRRRGLVLKRLTAAMRSSFLPCIFLVINTFALPLVEGCSSRTMPKPRPPTTRVSTARPNVTYNTYPCEPGYDRDLCLNGGTCFIVKVTDAGLYNCMCADGFVGQRCEYKNLDESYMPPRHRVMLETASIASGATIAVFLVVVICMYLYMHTKRRQKQSLSSSNGELSNDLERISTRSSISSKRESSTPQLPLHHVTRESGSESTSYPVYAETTLTTSIREIKEPP